MTELIAAAELARTYGYHPENVERFITHFGLSFTEKMLKAYEQKPKRSIRVNTLKCSKEKLMKRLTMKGFLLEESPYYHLGFIVKNEPLPLGATTEYLLGHYFLQSQASWLPVLALNPQPGEFVVDFAAAPGGKATHIAQKMGNDGILLCLDISRERMKALRSNLARCGVQNVVTRRMDSSNFWELKIKVDKILLDAPCTGEGLMAIDRERRMKRLAEDVTRMALLQKQLLNSALKSLKKGGLLVYSTCSTAPEENEAIIAWALREFPIEILELRINGLEPGLVETVEKKFQTSIQKAGRLFPHIHGTEGFFLCKLELKEELSI